MKVLSQVGECFCGARRYEGVLNRATGYSEPHTPECAAERAHMESIAQSNRMLAAMGARMALGRERAALPRPVTHWPDSASEDERGVYAADWAREQRAEREARRLADEEAYEEDEALKPEKGWGA